MIEAIKRIGRAYGAVKVTTLPLELVSEEYRRYYENWIATGKHANMHYLVNNREVRYNPLEAILPNAKSVIVMAFSYYPSRLQSQDAPQIAKYAYGRDYHKVLREVLSHISDAIKAEAYERGIGAYESRAIVDSVPFFERYWAAKSGLGFVGKNCNIIVPKSGSFLFLGEILTNIYLERSDRVLPNRCSTCSCCIDACPTQALSAEGLDARRCISYWTIEHRGEVPVDIAKNMGNRYFGCDTCQDVCPYNRKPLTQLLFPEKSELLELTDEDLKDMSEERYGYFFFGTSATRAKYEGHRRNAKIYLNNKS